MSRCDVPLLRAVPAVLSAFFLLETGLSMVQNQEENDEKHSAGTVIRLGQRYKARRENAFESLETFFQD